MIVSHRIRLKPNASQCEYFARACGVARFAYNWALSEWQRRENAGERVSDADLRRALNAIKRDRFPWMYDVSKNAPQQAIKNLGIAFGKFYSGKARYPRFKKKGQRDAFRADPGPEKARPNTVVIDGKRVKLAVIGWVNMCEEVRFAGRILCVVVSRQADHWYASFSIEVPYQSDPRFDDTTIGVDLGITTLATLSSGKRAPSPKPLRRLLKRVQRLSKTLNRRRIGSSNRAKAKTKLARLYERITNIRVDSLHKLSRQLVEYRTIVIEELNVTGMRANRHVARSVSQAGFYSFRRQLFYKAAMAGATVVVAPRWFPSSRMCSGCGQVKADLSLSDRKWTCQSCGACHDRDINAAQNLARYAESLPVSARGAATIGYEAGSGKIAERRLDSTMATK